MCAREVQKRQLKCKCKRTRLKAKAIFKDRKVGLSALLTFFGWVAAS
jgi:hypothetical protein